MIGATWIVFNPLECEAALLLQSGTSRARVIAHISSLRRLSAILEGSTTACRDGLSITVDVPLGSTLVEWGKGLNTEYAIVAWHTTGYSKSDLGAF